jgi:carbon-monoxide dehydrogenase medium subunit
VQFRRSGRRLLSPPARVALRDRRAAAALEVAQGAIRSARVGLTGAGTHAVRLSSVERALTGKPAASKTIEDAARGADADIEVVNSDIHASEEYRRAMIAVFTRRALAGALARVD